MLLFGFRLHWKEEWHCTLPPRAVGTVAAGHLVHKAGCVACGTRGAVVVSAAADEDTEDEEDESAC